MVVQHSFSSVFFLFLFQFTSQNAIKFSLPNDKNIRKIYLQNCPKMSLKQVKFILNRMVVCVCLGVVVKDSAFY